jgi:hypothetical protein
MQFVTDTWQPIGTLRIRSDDPTQARMDVSWRKYELRHWLALIGAALLLLAPVAWALSGAWVSASLFASIGLLMVSTATLLVPDLRVEFDGHESRED